MCCCSQYYWCMCVMMFPGDHVNISSLCYHWRPCWGPWSFFSWGLSWCPWPMWQLKSLSMSMVCAVHWIHDDVHGPGHCWELGCCPWPVLLPKSMAHANTIGQVCDPCCHQIPCGRPQGLGIGKDPVVGIIKKWTHQLCSQFPAGAGMFLPCYSHQLAQAVRNYYISSSH